MATAAAVVMGSAHRALRSLALVAVGVVCVIALSWVLTLLIPDVSISYTDNGEIASRIEPRLIALLTALASGAAGAYITSREEIADSMGGVAIAISLVPPLCVVGISLNQGEWAAAAGALTLFITNFLAILLAGGITFLLSGLGRLAVKDEDVRLRRNAFIMIVVATLLIAIPLGLASYEAVDAALEHRAAMQDVDTWLSGTQHQSLGVDIRDRVVVVTVEGTGELPPLRALANQLAQTLERPVGVNLRVLPIQVEQSE
jgi:uncharacterized membrane protein